MTGLAPDRRQLLGMGAAAAGIAAAPAFGLPKPSGRLDWTLHPPESVGMSRSRLETVRATIQKHLDSHEQLGAVAAIARRGKLVWFEALGVRDPESGAPMRKDDIFRMMSSSKPLTATCVLMLMDAGKLSIEDDVSRFIPSFKGQKVIEPPAGWEKVLKDPSLRADVAAQATLAPARRGVTIRDLLTHTSGLASVGDTLGPGPGMLVNAIDMMAYDPDATLNETIPKLGHAALDFQPGSRWRYSPLLGFDTLLHIVEVASGQPADVFMRERLFEPLGMRDTGFNLPREKQARLLRLYERRDEAWKPAKPLFGDRPTRYFSGAGGLMSTVHDAMQFEAMLFNRGELNGRRILKPDTVALMSTNQVGEMFAQWIPLVSAGQGFGLGVGITLDPARANWGRGRGAFGWGGAYGTESWVDPENDLMVAFFVQQPVRGALVDFQKVVRAAVVS